MPRSIAAALIVLVTVFLAPPTYAAHGKVGTWEVTTRIDGGTMQAMVDAARRLPVIESRLKERGVRFGKSGEVSLRYCMSADQVDYDHPPLVHSSSCQTVNLRTRGDTFNADVICHGTINGKGRIEITFTSAEHYHGLQTLTASVKHVELTRTLAIDAHWLTEDCKPGT